MDPFNINFSQKNRMFAEIITNKYVFLIKKNGGYFFWKTHFANRGFWGVFMRVYVLQLSPFLLSYLFFLLVSYFFFFISFFCFLSLWKVRRRAFEFGQAPDQMCAQEQINAWAYPHCRYMCVRFSPVIRR